MITNFEDYTFELTDYEVKNILPFVHKWLLHAEGKENAITNARLVAACPFKTSGPRIRKVIHELRTRDIILNLVASSSGYYWTTDEAEIDKYIKSCQERINSIREIVTSLKKQKYGQMALETVMPETPKSLKDALYEL